MRVMFVKIIGKIIELSAKLFKFFIFPEINQSLRAFLCLHHLVKIQYLFIIMLKTSELTRILFVTFCNVNPGLTSVSHSGHCDSKVNYGCFGFLR